MQQSVREWCASYTEGEGDSELTAEPSTPPNSPSKTFAISLVKDYEEWQEKDDDSDNIQLDEVDKYLTDKIGCDDDLLARWDSKV